MSQTASRRITFVATHEQFNGLLALSDLTGAPVSELLRRAITGYLMARRHEWADCVRNPQLQQQESRP